MAIRLPYETKAGEFSEGETIMQALEYCRLLSESCYAIGHFRKANDDFLTGQMFLAYGQAIENMGTALQRTATRHSTATLKDGRQ